MVATINEILHWPLFPIGILVLLGIAYWQGAISFRGSKKKSADTGDTPKGP